MKVNQLKAILYYIAGWQCAIYKIKYNMGPARYSPELDSLLEELGKSSNKVQISDPCNIDGIEYIP